MIPHGSIKTDADDYAGAAPFDPARADAYWHSLDAFLAEQRRRRNLRTLHRLRDGEPVSAAIEREREREQAQESRFRLPRGDARFILPEAKMQGGQVCFPVAERGGMADGQRRLAEELYRLGLKSKANRRAHCGVLGMRLRCVNGDYQGFRRFRCGGRYCPHCGPAVFTELFAKHIRLKPVAEKIAGRRRHGPGVIAKLDITAYNTGKMPTAEDVRLFNRHVRRLIKTVADRLGLGRDEWGALWCDEIGGHNTNLHAHAIWCGPRIPQSMLVDAWRRIRADVDGAYIVSIKRARSFEQALGHALKYTAKAARGSPERLAELEAVFHGVRRVHAIGAFYAPNLGKDDVEITNLDSGCCPFCQGALVAAGGWLPVTDLEREGLREVEDERRRVGRERVFCGPRGSP